MPSFVPRAALTIPKEFLHLAPSVIPGAGIGVFSSVTLPKGVRFGPYLGQCTFEVDSSYCWQIYSAKHKPSHVVDALDGTKSNWMRFVNCSRHFSEQNLVVFQFKGDLYYRTIRIIPRFTELLVFYGTQFATALNINLAMYNSQHFVCALKFVSGCAPPKLQKIKNNDALEEKTSKDYPLPALHKIPKVYELHEDLEGNNYASDFDLNVNVDYDDDCTDNSSYQCSISYRTHLRGSPNVPTDTINNIYNEDVDLNNVFICNFCNGSFKYKSNLAEHLKKHKIISTKPFTCKSCEFTTAHVNQFGLHLQLHDSNRRLQCKFCGYKFKNHTGLGRHVKKHYRLLDAVNNEYHCHLCTYESNSETLLSRHISTHKNSHLHKCDKCDFKTTSEYHFNRHIAMHSRLASKTCDLCGRTMLTKSYKKHMKSVHKVFTLGASQI